MKKVCVDCDHLRFTERKDIFPTQPSYWCIANKQRLWIGFLPVRPDDCPGFKPTQLELVEVKDYGD